MIVQLQEINENENKEIDNLLDEANDILNNILTRNYDALRKQIQKNQLNQSNRENYSENVYAQHLKLESNNNENKVYTNFLNNYSIYLEQDKLDEINKILVQMDNDDEYYMLSTNVMQLNYYIDYSNMIKIVKDDIYWYSSRIKTWSDDLKNVCDVLSKIGEGVDEKYIPVMSELLCIKNAIQIVLTIIDEVFYRYYANNSLFYGKILPFFLEILNGMQNKKSILWIIALCKYGTIFAKNETSGYRQKTIIKNLNNYIKEFTKIFKIADKKNWDACFNNWSDY